MPTEDELRASLRDSDGDRALDATEIIRRARRRRRPKIVAASAGALLVVAVVAVPAIAIPLAFTSAGGASSSSERAPAVGGASTAPRPDAQAGSGATGGAAGSAAEPGADACAAALNGGGSTQLGVTVDGAAVGSDGRLSGSIVLGDLSGGDLAARITGPVAVAILRGDDVIWAGSVELGSPALSLGPGRSSELPFAVAVTDCASGGALAAGDYDVEVSVPIAIGDDAARAIGGTGALSIG